MLPSKRVADSHVFLKSFMARITRLPLCDLPSSFRMAILSRSEECSPTDPSLPGLEDMIDQLFAATIGVTHANPYPAEISRAVERVVIEELIGLAASATMPQVRAVATHRLFRKLGEFTQLKVADEAKTAPIALLARDIQRFLNEPDTFKRPAPIIIPPGAPIGDPDPDYLG